MDPHIFIVCREASVRFIMLAVNNIFLSHGFFYALLDGLDVAKKEVCTLFAGNGLRLLAGNVFNY